MLCGFLTGVECYDRRWWRYAPVAGVVGATYALGLPALFLYLARRFKYRALRGDRDVQRALEWIWSPYRDGKEIWIGAECLRVLFLTSLVSALADTCELRVLCALLISLFFLVVLLQTHPHRRHSHHVLQMLSILVPLISMGWASAGGWENAERADGAGGAGGTGGADASFPGMLLLHLLVIVPPVLKGVFTVATVLYVWCDARTHAASSVPFARRRQLADHAADEASDDAVHDDATGEAVGAEAAVDVEEPTPATSPSPAQQRRRKKGKKKRRRKKAAAVRRRRKRKDARREKRFAESWSSWSSAPSLSPSSSSSDSDGDDGDGGDTATDRDPPRQRGMTGYLPTKGLKTHDEALIADQQRQIEDMVSLGHRKRPTAGTDSDASDRGADDGAATPPPPEGRGLPTADEHAALKKENAVLRARLSKLKRAGAGSAPGGAPTGRVAPRAVARRPSQQRRGLRSVASAPSMPAQALRRAAAVAAAAADGEEPRARVGRDAAGEGAAPAGGTGTKKRRHHHHHHHHRHSRRDTTALPDGGGEGGGGGVGGDGAHGAEDGAARRSGKHRHRRHHSSVHGGSSGRRHRHHHGGGSGRGKPRRRRQNTEGGGGGGGSGGGDRRLASVDEGLRDGARPQGEDRESAGGDEARSRQQPRASGAAPRRRQSLAESQAQDKRIRALRTAGERGGSGGGARGSSRLRRTTTVQQSETSE